MKLNKIISQRRYSLYPSFKIVYEWEDILADSLNLKIVKENNFKFKIFRRFENNGLVDFYHNMVIKKEEISLRFVMNARKEKLCILDKNTIPVIIDFWLTEKDLSAFYDAYRFCPLVLVTNLEVYEFLKSHDCPLKVEHWPLSYPDKYRMEENETLKKEYDFCIFGRPNPFFVRLLDEYSNRHQEFTYIMNNGDINHRVYITNKGDVVAEDTGRQSYLDMISRTKITCYTTPGLDEAKKETASFNQITPRLFEMLSNECFVIGHYPNSSDVNYYKIHDIVPNVNNYDEFEYVLDKMLKSTFEKTKIRDFLNKNYTSTRIPMLKDTLEKYSIVI